MMRMSLIFKQALYWVCDLRAVTDIGLYNFSTALYYTMAVIND